MFSDTKKSVVYFFAYSKINFFLWIGFEDDFFGSELVNGTAILGTETMIKNPFENKIDSNIKHHSKGDILLRFQFNLRNWNLFYPYSGPGNVKDSNSLGIKGKLIW